MRAKDIHKVSKDNKSPRVLKWIPYGFCARLLMAMRKGLWGNSYSQTFCFLLCSRPSGMESNMENIVEKKENCNVTTENGAYEIWIKESVPSKSQYGYSTKIIKVPVTKEQFKEYYRQVDAFRIKMQYHNRCTCPENMRLSCDMDCTNCKFKVCGDEMSLNEIVTDEEGNEVEFGDLIPSTDDSPDEVIMKKELYAELHKCVGELPPYQKKIIDLFLEGKSEREIGKIVFRDHKAIHFQLGRIFKDIKEKLKDFNN